MCGKTRKTGQFIVKRKTIPKRLSAKLSELKRSRGGAGINRPPRSGRG